MKKPIKDGKDLYHSECILQAHASGKIGVLCGHGFHLLSSDGSQIGERGPQQADSVVFYRDQEAVGSYRVVKVSYVFNTEGRGIRDLT